MRLLEPVGTSQCCMLVTSRDRDTLKKLSAGGLGDFPFYRTIYADQGLLFVLQADSLFAHFFACVSPASLVTLESQADYSPFGATVNTPRLWKLLEFTRLHGSSRQKYLMMSKRLSFRLLAFHKGYLLILSALSGRVFRAYESLLYPGFISFDALPRSTYLNSVDRAFFVRHIDTVLAAEADNFRTTRKVYALLLLLKNPTCL